MNVDEFRKFWSKPAEENTQHSELALDEVIDIQKQAARELVEKQLRDTAARTAQTIALRRQAREQASGNS